jgi:hypothetical protein
MKKYLDKNIITQNIHKIENILGHEYIITTDQFSITFIKKLISEKKFQKIMKNNLLDIELHCSNILINLHKENPEDLIKILNDIIDIDTTDKKSYYIQYFFNMIEKSS